MLWVHGLVIIAFYGIYAAYEKFRHGISRRWRDIVPVCCLLLFLRAGLAFCLGNSGNVMNDILADLVAFLSFGLWEGILTAVCCPKARVPVPTVRKMPFEKKDFLIMGGICLFYGCVAFWHLGILTVPVTEYTIASGGSVVLDFGRDVSAGILNWYLKDYGHCNITLECRNTDQEPWQYVQEIPMERVFCWGSCPLEASGRYIRLTNSGADMAIGELVIQDKNGSMAIPVNRKDMEALFDEAALFPEVIDYRSGSYFDESYYTRTAYDFINGTPSCETTHPPLGKILITLGVVCFGTSPFGFRIVGTIFGILMLPFLYLLGRDMTKSRLLGGFACFLFAFDFMHFTQARIATIDVYITFFTILMFYFMYRYSRMSFYDQPLWRTFVPLGACGISFGLGIASKWTGFYAGAGLAVLFFRVLYFRYQEYAYASEKPEKSSNGISHMHMIGHFREYTVKTLLFCVLFFLAVPFLIYLLSYIPFSNGTDAGLLERMWENQKYMLRFHTGLKADHPYASSWYQWPLMIRPVFYYSRIIDDSMRQGISAFGNPLVWWAGIPAFFYMLCLSLRKREQNAVFLCTAYAFCYLPWSLVTRCTFAYHYFPSVPFVVCMIVYSFAQWEKYISPRKFAAIVVSYSVLTFGLFIMFYPVISGLPVSEKYVADILRWLKTWAFVQ